MSAGHCTQPHEPIAVVGIAAELPSGDLANTNFDYPRFNKFLLDGGQSYVRIPKERFNIDSWHGRGLGKVATIHGSFLKDIDQFDHVEFGISARDARAMSLSTRKLIELSFLALLDSGIDYRGQNVGCYASATNHDILSIAEPDVYEAQGSFGGIPCMVANKISYHLDLRGPSIPVDTACSSSLTATHLAVQALRAGECESAVVAACQLNLRLADFVQYSQGSVLSPDGKCKPFDIDADGFSRGEGAVAIVLKPLSAALRDGDHIYANILGTGLSSSGSLAPVYAPAAIAQVEAMKRAFRGTGRDPREVDYVELHATGTAAGDPSEANWVGQHFQRDSELLVGSVKGNIGHLEIPAFLASLCKVCGIFETSIVPPNVNLRERNPAIGWDSYKLAVPLESTPIHARDSSGRLLVSMNSSGIGGANGHAVLESSPVPDNDVSAAARGQEYPRLIMIGGMSPASATGVGKRLKEVLVAHRDRLHEVSAICGRRVRQMSWRSFAVARPGQDLSEVDFPTPTLVSHEQPPIVFLFSGQGPQHVEMGRQLYARFPVFRNTIDELDAYHEELSGGTSLIRDIGLFGDAKPSASMPTPWPIAVILPSLAMIQIALFDLLSSFGLRPDIVMGHSAGETSLLYASGAASKRVALEVAYVRGREMEVVETANGGMAALSCATFQADEIIALAKASAGEGVLDIACYNGPQAVAIAGERRLVARAVEIATHRGILARTIQTNVAVHSAMMDLGQASYRARMEEVFARNGGSCTPTVTTYSTATGTLLDRFTEDYFWQNSRGPVRFSQSVRSVLRAHPSARFIEISPHAVLSLYLQELGAPAVSILCPMRRTKAYETHQEETVLLGMIGRLVAAGYNDIDFRALNEVKSLDHSIQLPPYPFARKPVPYLPGSSRLLRRQLGRLVRPLCGDGLRVNQATHPELAQHVINQEPIKPAAGYLEMVLEAGARVIQDVQFRAIFSLASDSPPALTLQRDGSKWTVLSQHATTNYSSDDDMPPRIHAEGSMMDGECFEEVESLSTSDALNRLVCKLEDATDFYAGFQHFAQYGPVFSRIRRCYFGLDEALVEVEGLDHASQSNYVIHPAILDACLHATVHPRFTANWDKNVYYLPSALGSLTLHQPGPITHLLSGTLYAYATLTKWQPNELTSEIRVVSSDGIAICTLRDLTVARHFINLPSPVSKRFEIVSQPVTLTPVLSRVLDPTCIESQTGPRFCTYWYRIGNELEIQAALKVHDVNGALSVWVIAREGSDGDSARGFTRSLRRELAAWDVNLLIAASALPEEKVEALARRLSSVPDLEHELYVDTGFCLHVPRIREVSLADDSTPPIYDHTSTSTGMGAVLNYLGTFLPSRFRRLADSAAILDKDSPKIRVADTASGLPALFNPSALYILVGGIGSLGLHIALWMYERGARHLILTSRSGRRSLERAGDVLALRILDYLEGRTDLTLDLRACDASSARDMKAVLSSTRTRIAGCMLLSGVLADRTFFQQDKSTFEAAFKPKVHAMRVLEEVMDIDTLDFFVTLSSIATFGNAGQTNYSSANTALEGMVRQHNNAFTIVAPAITDTVSISDTMTHGEQGSRVSHLLSWAFSARELCDCIEDGIRMMSIASVGTYVPNFNWDLVRRHLGPSPLYDHLTEVKGLSDSLTVPRRLTREGLLTIVLRHVDVPADVFSPYAPLAQYGIDSLSAGRLSFALKDHFSVSSMQLLGGLTFEDLFFRLNAAQGAKTVADRPLGGDAFDWEELSRPGQPLVKLVDLVGGNPLILIHGASGSVVSFMTLQQTFTTSLWALQSTPDTPMHSIEAMAEFYYKAIKNARPNGPYRIGAYSGTSLIPFLIAERLLADGDTITQFCLLDHFPLLFMSPHLEPDALTMRQRSPSHAMMMRVLQSMLRMYKAEPSASRQQLAEEFEKAADGAAVSPAAALRWKTFSSIVIGTYEFIFELIPYGEPSTPEYFRRALAARLRRIQVPLSIYVAQKGFSIYLDESGTVTEPIDLGAREVCPDAAVVFLDGTHFSFMHSDTLLHDLQRGW